MRNHGLAFHHRNHLMATQGLSVALQPIELSLAWLQLVISVCKLGSGRVRGGLFDVKLHHVLLSLTSASLGS